MSWNPEQMRKPIDSTAVWGLVNPILIPFNLGRMNVSEERLIRATRLAAEIAKDSILKNLAAFILEAHTLLKNAEYSQSLQSSWLVFETHIDRIWNDHVKSQNIDKNRMSKFQDRNRWSADYIIETLNLVGKLDITMYKYLMEVKAIRNRIVHSGTNVSKDEAQKCLEIATQLVREACQMK
jgi:hypothetical protein